MKNKLCYHLILIISIFFFLLLLPHYGVLATEIEDELETQIDSREPRSFVATQFTLLNVRQNNFDEYECMVEGEMTSIFVPNWETFATGYWYEYRGTNCTCPMTPRGIAAMVDWALLVPCLFGNINQPPKTIFVHNYMLSHFVESTLYFMNPNYRFVLITGGTDLTIPRSIDKRYRPLRGFSNQADGGRYYQTLLTDPRIIHWFSENHDLTNPKISTLPTGMVGVNSDSALDDLQYTSNATSVLDRPLKFMVSDRIRTGGRGQWDLRAEVSRKCANSSLCFAPPKTMINDFLEIPHSIFLQQLVSVPFVACVHGGGIDPSPKAWEAILHGTIPIVQHSTLTDGYEKLPVMFINNWDELFTNPEQAEILLKNWLHKLAPFYGKNSELRLKTLNKLKASYWMEQVYHHVDNYYQNHQNESSSNNTDNNSNLRPHHRRLRSRISL